MAFSVIIENAAGQEIERCWRIGSEDYLVQESEDDFPLLSNLNLASYDVFSSKQGIALAEELLRLVGKVRDAADRSFLERIAELAKLISVRGGWTITFTPFSR